jgi:hypothetical protein
MEFISMRLCFFRQRFIIKVEREAKPLYEKIIFNHEDSIYFVARKTSGNCGRQIYINCLIEQTDSLTVTSKTRKMIIYNVTTNIHESVHDQWMIWMQHKHIPEVLATGKFTAARLVRY